MNAARPQLCTGSVRHARLRPAAHRFAHGVYFLRLPLRAMAAEPSTGSRWLSRNRFNLLAFHDADHGDGRTPALAWIERLLAAEGIADADGEIWLQTFPRVLGFVFNPVSFWFCHRRDGTLRAILCEVNNTFGERHCYLLENGGTLPWGAELEARKVFHVSPFCRIAGRYRFRFMLAGRADGAEQATARIEHDDEAGPLILTSISGRAAPVDDRAVLRAFFGHPLLTLAVVARIHWHALRLWLKRVPFHAKPQPPATEISR